jgi:hypothetical protein
VRHHQGGGADAALDGAQFHLHAFPQLGIEVGQRLVQQQQLRLDRHGAGQGHALLLPAGKLARVAVRHRGEADQVQRTAHALIPRRAGHAAHLQPEGDVLGHRHVREQRVALEHDAHAALVGGNAGQVSAIQQHAAAGGFLEAGDDVQRGGLAAAGRT